MTTLTQTGLVLETEKVLLRPVETSDFDTFLQLAQDREMWQYFSLDLSDAAQLRNWMDILFTDKAERTRLPFTIVEKATGLVAGSMSLMNISFHHLRLEIGASWLGRSFRSTGINLHAKYAMIRYAFEELKFERVEFKTDVLNTRARKGLQKAGGVEEGILRSHMTMWNNRRRSSVFYSILKAEWPGLQQTIFSNIQ
ncbi:MAG: GNAT family protein [Chitinophagaceae bacterium]